MRSVTGKHFEQHDFTESDLSRQLFENCTFTASDFSSLQIDGSRFVNCSFRACDLSCVDFGSSAIVNCVFEGCDLAVTTYPGNTISDSTYTGCDISGANFSQSKVENCTFHGCDLEGASFEECGALNLGFNECILTDLTGLELNFENDAEEEVLPTQPSGPTFALADGCSFDPVVRIGNENGCGSVVGMGLRWKVEVPTIFRDAERFIFVEPTPWGVLRVTSGIINEDGLYDDQLEWNATLGTEVELTSDSYIYTPPNEPDLPE